jgi:hypothetical protein
MKKLITLSMLLIFSFMNINCAPVKQTPTSKDTNTTIKGKSFSGNVKNIKIEGKDEYITSVGNLKDGFVIIDGEATFHNNNTDLKYGLIYFDKNFAIPVKNNIEIYTGQVSKSEFKITFIKDLKTNNWLATDGTLFYDFKKDTAQLIEGTEVLIIDEKDLPIRISGKDYSYTKLLIHMGQVWWPKTK